MNGEQVLRPVSKAVNEALGEIPTGSFNFGLYFQKWFFVSTRDWKCPTHRARSADGGSQHPVLDNMVTSLRLFNGDQVAFSGTTGKWSHDQSEVLLKQKHRHQEACAGALGRLGYVFLELRAVVLTPLIIGLGNEHPTEKGFRFDWSLGIPSIPASSIKGVVRLAHLVNELRGLPDFGDASGDELNKEQILSGTWGTCSVFGSGGDHESCRGKVIFFDAYPATFPTLKAEIMNCHYREYLTEGNRGPTEDQQPRPLRYWAVDTKDRKGKPVEFVFRLLLDKRLADIPDYRKSIEDALESALVDHGLGAKTAVGHGRFRCQQTANSVPKDALNKGENAPATKDETPVPPNPDARIWENAVLEWNVGKNELIAGHPKGRAFADGLDVVSEPLRVRLEKRKQRKPVRARVVVEPIGTGFRIIRAEDT